MLGSLGPPQLAIELFELKDMPDGSADAPKCAGPLGSPSVAWHFFLSGIPVYFLLSGIL